MSIDELQGKIDRYVEGMMANGNMRWSIVKDQSPHHGNVVAVMTNKGARRQDRIRANRPKGVPNLAEESRTR